MATKLLSGLCLGFPLYPCLQPCFINFFFFFSQTDVLTFLLLAVGVVHSQIGKKRQVISRPVALVSDTPCTVSETSTQSHKADTASSPMGGKTKTTAKDFLPYIFFQLVFLHFKSVLFFLQEFLQSFKCFFSV